MNACIARLIKENRMPDNTILPPAAELAAKNEAHIPNEGPEYHQENRTGSCFSDSSAKRSPEESWF
jgi:hypothetical protein